MADGEEDLLKIGGVARRTGFTRQQIHNFLVMGLLREDSKTTAGHRLFGPETLRRLAIIRGLRSRGYELAEIRRTWKAFLRLVLVCFLLGLSAAACPERALAGAPRPKLTAEDEAAATGLFAGLRKMMIDGDSGMVAGIMDPAISRQRLHQIVESLDAEFESRSYTDFTCKFDLKDPHDVEVVSTRGAKRVRVRTYITYQYFDRSEGPVPLGIDVPLEFWFELVKGPAGWRIADGDFFDTLTSTQNKIFGDIFLWAAIIFIVGSFWGWMLLDCSFRNWGGRKLPWVLAVLFLPGLGALAYFFAVWMRQGPED